MSQSQRAKDRARSAQQRGTMLAKRMPIASLLRPTRTIHVHNDTEVAALLATKTAELSVPIDIDGHKVSIGITRADGNVPTVPAGLAAAVD